MDTPNTNADSITPSTNTVDNLPTSGGRTPVVPYSGDTPQNPTTVIPPPQTGENLNQGPRQAPPNPTQAQPPHPAVQKASMGSQIVKGIADVLSPRQFKTVINEDGTSKQVPLPRDRRDIGMSIALAALTGAFSGLGQRGPGATGRRRAIRRRDRRSRGPG